MHVNRDAYESAEDYWDDEYDDFCVKERAFEARYGGDFDSTNFGNFAYDHSNCFPFFSVPFRDTVWAHDVEDKAVTFLALDRHRRLDTGLWGNGGYFRVYRYQQAALLVDLVARDPDDATRAAKAFCAWQRGEAPPAPDETPPSYPEDTHM